MSNITETEMRLSKVIASLMPILANVEDSINTLTEFVIKSEDLKQSSTDNLLLFEDKMLEIIRVVEESRMIIQSIYISETRSLN